MQKQMASSNKSHASGSSKFVEPSLIAKLANNEKYNKNYPPSWWEKKNFASLSKLGKQRKDSGDYLTMAAKQRQS